MPRHAKLSRTDDVGVYLPPPDLALSTAACAFVNMNGIKQMTMGGGVSITVTCLRATFPDLYDLPNKPFKKYVQKDRGKKAPNGKMAGWSPDDLVVKNSAVDMIVKAALALTYFIVRRPPQNPMSQITRRFNALYAIIFPTVQAPVIDLDPALDFHESATWLSTQGLDIIILKSLLFIKDADLPGPTGKAFVAQLKLFAAYAEMTPYLTMKTFLDEGLSQAILLPQVGLEALRFLDAEIALREKHPPNLFPYIKVLRLEGHETLAPVNYPNLCKVANTRKRRLDGTFKDYRSNKESLSRLSDKEVEDAVAKPPIKKKCLSQADFTSVQSIYNLSKEELTKVVEGKEAASTTALDKFKILVNKLSKALSKLPQEEPN